MKKKIKGKNKAKFSRKEKIIDFLRPTKWKILLTAFLYVSNYVTVFGTIFQLPIFYFYWNYQPTTIIELSILFYAHAIYLYLLSALLIKVFT